MSSNHGNECDRSIKFERKNRLIWGLTGVLVESIVDIEATEAVPSSSSMYDLNVAALFRGIVLNTSGSSSKKSRRDSVDGHFLRPSAIYRKNKMR